MEVYQSGLHPSKINLHPQPALPGVGQSSGPGSGGLCSRDSYDLSRIKYQKVFQTELLLTTNEAILIEETDFAQCTDPFQLLLQRLPTNIH